jgi:hypothetical protein
MNGTTREPLDTYSLNFIYESTYIAEEYSASIFRTEKNKPDKKGARNRLLLLAPATF